MSNRLNTVDRIPLTADAEVASNAAQHYFVAARSQVEQVTNYGETIAEALRAVWHALTWVERRVEEAAAMRELATMNDRMLADIGLKRSDIPMVCKRMAANDDYPRARAA